MYIIPMTGVKEKYKKEMDRNNNKTKTLYKCITANTSTIWQQAAHIIYQLLSPRPNKSHTKKGTTVYMKFNLYVVLM